MNIIDWPFGERHPALNGFFFITVVAATAFIAGMFFHLGAKI